MAVTDNFGSGSNLAIASSQKVSSLCVKSKGEDYGTTNQDERGTDFLALETSPRGGTLKFDSKLSFCLSNESKGEKETF